MKSPTSMLALTVAALLAVPALAQQPSSQDSVLTVATARADSGETQPTATTEKKKSGEESPETAKRSAQPTIVFQHIRATDQRGVEVFEAPKNDTVPYTGFKLGLGASFTQQFQDLKHHNAAAPNVVNGTDLNQLINIGAGFNNAVANLYVNAQMARGIRVSMTSYLSSRHHDESWVKEGYLLVDALPWKNATLDKLMQVMTVKVGHFEVNYGDEHFRRSDNGNSLYNPFVGNLIMDAFTTEIGGEIYFRKAGWMAMGGITGGEIHGQVASPDKRSPSYLGKVGFDRQLDEALRVRLTGSMYYNGGAVNNTLYSGDRAGSRYYDVMENVSSTETAQAWSGAIQPGFRRNVKAFVVNPFVKYRGLELFGNIERARGKASNETANRTWDQYSGEAVYRFLPREQLYVGARYNTAKGQLAGLTGDVNVRRYQLASGWFVTPGILAKVEYVNQKYLDFPITDIRHGGRFNGIMVEGAVGF